MLLSLPRVFKALHNLFGRWGDSFLMDRRKGEIIPLIASVLKDLSFCLYKKFSNEDTVGIISLVDGFKLKLNPSPKRVRSFTERFLEDRFSILLTLDNLFHIEFAHK